MNSVETVLLENIDNPNSCFVFPTDVAASRWADHLLCLRGGTVMMRKFIAWDVFKKNSVRSKVQNKKSIPSALRKIFTGRLVRENAELCEKGEMPVFSSLIKTQWAGQASQFVSWLTSLLPQLGSWFKKSSGQSIHSILSENHIPGFDEDDRDLYVLARRYAQFLDAHGLFEPAWETPPFDDTGTEYFIFFPESLSDYGEYRELLAASEHVKIISAENAEKIASDVFFYTNSRSEITEAALYIRALHEKKSINWDSIAVCIPDSENYEPYVLREFTNRNIPFVKRSGKPLSDYPAGQLFHAIAECISREMAFSPLVNLILNWNFPWKDTAQIQNLVEFGIKNNCISSWTEIEDGKEKKINVWEDAFNEPYGRIDPVARQFFNDLRRRLHAFRAASSFAEARRQYFIFRERFFDMEKCTAETNLVLSRCISELMYLCEIEKDFPNAQAADPFMFFAEYLGDVNYLAQQQASGVTILPYRTAACAPFDCHIVFGANQDSLSEVFSRLDFLPRLKREKLGITDEDASAAFIDLHKINSFKHAAFFCSEQTFSGYAIAHSRLSTPSKPAERYAPIQEFCDKFSDDYFRAENFTDDAKQATLHEIQKQGFDEWKSRREQSPASKGKWNTDETLMELIRTGLAKNQSYPGKYSVSASSLEPYFSCSLKWLFKRVLNIENIQIEASLMAEDTVGLVYHAVLNSFFFEIKKGNNTLSSPDYLNQNPVLPAAYGEFLDSSLDAVFVNFPKLISGEKSEMSSLTVRLLRAEKKHFHNKLENFLAVFLSYFSGYRVTGTEIPYQAEQDSFYLNGVIDCILEDAREGSETKGKYVIVDFKLKGMPERGDCTGDGKNGLSNFQLPMYVSLTEENEKVEVSAALFFSILNTEPEVIFGSIKNVNTNEIIPKKEEKRILRESDKYKQIMYEFRQKTKQFANEIEIGKFSVFESEYSECYDCNYNKICRTVYKIDSEKNITPEKH